MVSDARPDPSDSWTGCQSLNTDWAALYRQSNGVPRARLVIAISVLNRMSEVADRVVGDHRQRT